MRLEQNTVSRIESEMDVKAYIQNLKYAIHNGAKISFQARRLVDDDRDERFTNQYAIHTLFPDEDPLEVIKRELLTLNENHYIRTVKDIRFPSRSEMREFGKVFSHSQEVYIKIRVELLGQNGAGLVFVMSFHFSDRKFSEDMFPYRKN